MNWGTHVSCHSSCVRACLPVCMCVCVVACLLFSTFHPIPSSSSISRRRRAQNTAALTIQSAWKAYSTRKHDEYRRKRRDAAAVIMQKHWRSFVVRRNYSVLRREAAVAAEEKRRLAATLLIPISRSLCLRARRLLWDAAKSRVVFLGGFL